MIGRAEPTLACQGRLRHRGGMSGGQVNNIDDSPELIIISVHSDQPQTNAGQARRVPLAEPDDRREVGVAGGNERTKACNARRRLWTAGDVMAGHSGCQAPPLFVSQGRFPRGGN